MKNANNFQKVYKKGDKKVIKWYNKIMEKNNNLTQLNFFDFNENMGTCFKKGDKVKLNQRYFDEGLERFGSDLRYPRKKNHYFEVKKCIAIKDQPDLVYIDGGEYKIIEYIAACFLQKISDNNIKIIKEGKYE